MVEMMITATVHHFVMGQIYTPCKNTYGARFLLCDLLWINVGTTTKHNHWLVHMKNSQSHVICGSRQTVTENPASAMPSVQHNKCPALWHVVFPILLLNGPWMCDSCFFQLPTKLPSSSIVVPSDTHNMFFPHLSCADKTHNWPSSGEWIQYFLPLTTYFSNTLNLIGCHNFSWPPSTHNMTKQWCG